MAYQYINLVPVAAQLQDVVDAHSQYSEGVKRETLMANAAPDLLVCAVSNIGLLMSIRTLLMNHLSNETLALIDQRIAFTESSVAKARGIA